MSASFQTSTRFETQPEKLLSLLSDPAFHEDRWRVLDAVHATGKTASNSADQKVVVITTVQHPQGVDGVDTTRTETLVYTYRFDFQASEVSWVMTSPHGDQFDLHGSMVVRTCDMGCELVYNASIEVSIPVLGNKMEQLVLDVVRHNKRQTDELIARKLGAAMRVDD